MSSSELGHLGVGDGVDHFGPILGNTALFVLLADHKAGDVLEEQQRDFPLAA